MDLIVQRYAKIWRALPTIPSALIQISPSPWWERTSNWKSAVTSANQLGGHFPVRTFLNFHLFYPILFISVNIRPLVHSSTSACQKNTLMLYLVYNSWQRVLQRGVSKLYPRETWWTKLIIRHERGWSWVQTSQRGGTRREYWTHAERWRTRNITLGVMFVKCCMQRFE